MAAHATIEIDGQYRELREDAGWLHRERAVLAFTGPDAASLLQGQVTNDVEALDPGEGCYAALLDRKGHLQADMRVLALAPGEFLVDLEPAGLEATERHFQLYKLGSDVELSTLELELVSVIGPRAGAALGAPPLAREGCHAELGLNGVKARAIATDVGFDLLLPQEDVDTLGAALRTSGVAPVSEEAAEISRVASGRPRFGHELVAGTMPAEAGITERAVSFTKGCYIGQETVARLHYRGKPNRHLRGLRAAAALAPGDTVSSGERELGRVGSAVLSPAQGSLALAILRREATPGELVTVGDAAVDAEVVELPFAVPQV
ncbi:MAG: hypothetical protein QOJ01_165 [Solirubrobacterales bacterium]|nr:hypothetical protein [Solirubrobacterales bacterium]